MEHCNRSVRQRHHFDSVELANSSDGNNRQRVNPHGRVENTIAANTVKHSSLLPCVRGFTGRSGRSTDLRSTNALRNTTKPARVLHHKDHHNRVAILDLCRGIFPGHICHFSGETPRYQTTLEVQGVG